MNSFETYKNFSIIPNRRIIPHSERLETLKTKLKLLGLNVDIIEEEDLLDKLKDEVSHVKYELELAISNYNNYRRNHLNRLSCPLENPYQASMTSLYKKYNAITKEIKQLEGTV